MIQIALYALLAVVALVAIVAYLAVGAWLVLMMQLASIDNHDPPGFWFGIFTVVCWPLLFVRSWWKNK